MLITTSHAQVIIAPDSACYGENIIFKSTLKPPFKWHEDTLLVSTDSVYNFKAIKSSKYILKSTNRIDTFYLFVTPNIEIDFNYLSCKANADSVYCIVDLFESKYNYKWLIDGDTNRIKYIFNFECLPLMVIDKFNCKVTDTICDECNYKLYQVELPDAFNPYSVITQNRVFQPVGNGVKNIKMSIYTVRGECIYKKEMREFTPNQKISELAWDGKFKGDYCPMGMYVYIVTYTTFNNTKTETIRGLFHLLN